MNRRNSPYPRGTKTSLLMAARAASHSKAVLLGAVLLLGTAAGCSAPAPELNAETASTLQAQVLAVTEAAAANDPAGSLARLNELGTKLDQAAASGGVSSNRHQSIRSAIDAVRADLTAQQAAAQATEQAAAEQAAAEQAAAERAAAEQAAPPPAVVAPAPVPADNSQDRGKASEKGKGPGKD